MAKGRNRRNSALKEIRVYFEGTDALRQGFAAFFGKAKIGSNVQFIAAGNGISALKKADKSHPNAWNILLKDSEGPVQPDSLRTLGIGRKYARNVFWMVELMESWFLADPEALASYYGFSGAKIRQTSNVERVPKSEVLKRLKDATRRTSKGEYNKVTHAPDLLMRLDPVRVKQRAENCRKLFEAIAARIDNSPA